MRHTKFRLIITLVSLGILFFITSIHGIPVYAAGDDTPGVQVDGLVDTEYSHLAYLPLSGTLAPGDLYGYQDQDDPLCYWAFVVDRAYNDNVYANKDADDPYMALDGWLHDHDFTKLSKSDFASFEITFGNNQSFIVRLDYLNENGTQIKSGQIGDGINDGLSPHLTAARTSLHWNLLNSNWQGGDLAAMKPHSPPYNYNDSGQNYWEWQMIYEFSIAKSEMGGSCGTATRDDSHNSPSKTDGSVAMVGDYVWLDADKDGIQDDGGAAAGVANVTVHLKNSSNVTIRTTQTSQAGYYIFTNLSAGTYYVEFEKPIGYTYTTRDAGADDAIDSDADDSSGSKTASFGLASGQKNLTLDAGLIVPKPGIALKKYTNDADADSPTDNDVPKVAPGASVTWKYVVENTGDIAFAKDDVVVTDNRAGVTPVFDSVVAGFGDADALLEPGEKWLYKATGTAQTLTFSQNFVVNGCLTEQNQPRPVYSNTGKVVVPGATDSDPSHYCNPPAPAITLKKLTNGADANDPDGGDVPQVPVNDTVTWTYEVKNTGNVPFTKASVVVTDDQTGVSPTYLSGDDGDNIFEPGETWLFQATQPAKNLVLGMSGVTVVPGCAPGQDDLPRATYENIGTVTIGNLIASDPSHYCNPPNPSITLKKLTNGADANDPDGGDVPQVPVNDTVTWTYEVKNTGNVPFTKASVVVTDDQTGVSPTYLSGDDGDNIFEPGETWLFQATQPAKNLVLGMSGVTVVPGCAPGQDDLPRATYENIGTVTIGNLIVSDPSHYCNPPAPAIDIKKYTNEADADGASDLDVPELTPGQTVTWKYVVTNLGNVEFDKSEVTVTDSIPGVNPVLDTTSDDGNDGKLSPNEDWIYTAQGTVADLLDPNEITDFTIVPGCSKDNTSVYGDRATYENIGKVVVPGDDDSDPSHYCNPPVPGITIKKYTNGFDADDANGNDVPEIDPTNDVTWLYVVKNTGNVSFTVAQVTVTDDIVGVNPQRIVSSDNGDGILSPGESWQYEAKGKAADLLDPNEITDFTIVPGCSDNNTSVYGKRNTYENIGKVVVPGATDSDPSHYCNPPAPAITLKKLTNGADANDPDGGDVPQVPVNDTVTWTYEVKNTGNVPFTKASVVVTDDQTGVSPTYLSGDDGDNIFEPGETWLFQATQPAKNLVLGMSGVTVVPGCAPGQDDLPRATYKNIGTVTIGNLIVSDPSHYCNPPAPAIDIKKYTNDADADSPTGNDVPKIAPNGAVVWTYVVSNIGNIAFAKDDVVVTDNRSGVTPLLDSKLIGNLDDILEPGEKWLYKATGTAQTLSFSQDFVVNGCLTEQNQPRPVYSNTGTVVVPGATDTDPSHYCNPPAPAITLKKLTNGADANDPDGGDVPQVPVNDTVTWTYEVKNTGNVPFTKASVVVTDDQTGVSPTYLSGDDGDNIFEPGETWLFQATQPAKNLVLGMSGVTVVPGCAPGQDDLPRATYKNIGTVTIGNLIVSDPSHYCNPPAPAIDIKKYTNDADADSPTGNDVPKIAPNGAVVWTYVVSNIGNIAFAKDDVVVTDNRSGVTPLLDSKLIGNLDDILEPGEKWLYKATGTALILTPDLEVVVEGCLTEQNQPRPVYSNIGTVVVPGATDSDPSHYCNPQGPNIEIKKYTNDADADSPTGNDVPKIAPNGAVVWTYVVSNIGNTPFAKDDVVVTDNRAGVTPVFDSVVPGFGNDNDILEPGEKWLYKATGTALTLSFSQDFVVNGCLTEQNQPRPVYNNTGTVVVPGATDTDPSHYCNPVALGTLGDRVWYDVDWDGVQDDTELGVPNVTVNLLDGTCSASIGMSDVTDAFGIYGFENLEPGSYCVQFVLATLPSGYVLTKQNIGDDAADSDAATDGKSSPVTLTGGQTNLTVDAGIVLPSLDVTATPLCVKDAPYVRYSVTPVNIDPGANPVTVRWLNATTNKELYKFTGQPLSNTVLWPEAGIDSNGVGNQWPGWSFIGGKWVDNGSELRPQVKFELQVNPVVTTTLDYPPATPTCATAPRASLGDRVWDDKDKDGVQDNGEPGLAGVTVKLFNGENCTVDTGMSDVTDQDGIYGFTQLMPGSYCAEFVKSTIPPGANFTSTNSGSDDNLDSDADANGKTGNVLLKSGDNRLDVDAGLIRSSQQALSAVGDRVWFDENKNGIQNQGEEGVENFRVDVYSAAGLAMAEDLTASGGTFVKSTTTNENGKYLLSELTPGPYYLEFIAPAGYFASKHNVNGNSQDELDSDPLMPFIALSISDGNVQGELGKPLAYTIFYTNTDPVLAAVNVVISTTVPPGTTFVPASSNPAWRCTKNTEGGICTLTLSRLEPNLSGSATFVVLLSNSEPKVPNVLDLIADLTQGTVARTQVVTLAPGETNLTVDAGIIKIEAGAQTPTPTEPTNLPEGEQPGQKEIFLPTVQKP